MSTPLSAETNPEDEAIRQHLLLHPDFLQRNSDLLEKLEVSHGVSGAASFLERQVSVLKDKNQTLQGQLDDLVHAARSNEQILKRLQHLTLELLRAHNLDHLLSTCQDVLRGDFNADYVAFRLFHHQQSDIPSLHYVKPDNVDMKSFESLFKTLTPVCGPCEQEQLRFLFKDNAPDIQSVALIPLQSDRSVGLLALGSQDVERFHSGAGTVFLAYLGELIATAISQHIND